MLRDHLAEIVEARDETVDAGRPATEIDVSILARRAAAAALALGVAAGCTRGSDHDGVTEYAAPPLDDPSGQTLDEAAAPSGAKGDDASAEASASSQEATEAPAASAAASSHPAPSASSPKPGPTRKPRPPKPKPRPGLNEFAAAPLLSDDDFDD